MMDHLSTLEKSNSAVLSPDGNFVMYPVSKGNVVLYNTNNGQRQQQNDCWKG